VRRILKFLALAGVGTIAIAMTAGSAFAAPQITGPSGIWPSDGSGNPKAGTVSFTGYPTPGQIKIEQCDGIAPTTPGYVVSLHCDNSVGVAVPADGSGNGTFDATNPNSAFTPFKGVGGDDFFACVGVHDPDPTPAQNPDGVPVFRNCQVRVSTDQNNTTSDQQYLTMTLPDTNPQGQIPEVPYAVILPIGAVGIGGAFLVIRKRRQSARTAA
jgi:hypothetical protein